MSEYECKMCGSLVADEDAEQARSNMEALDMNLHRLTTVREDREELKEEVRKLKAGLASWKSEATAYRIRCETFREVIKQNSP